MSQVILEDLLYVASLDSIYKYTSAENAILLLENKKLHFNTPLKFNDPYDCHPLLVKISDKFIYNTLSKSEFNIVLNSHKFTTSQFYLNFVKNFPKTQAHIVNNQILPNVKIICFSEKKDNLLMWAHYARNHSGVCFEFKPNKMINYLGGLSKSSGDSGGIFFKVIYDDERTNYPFDSSEDLSPILMWIKTKSIEWRYEQEIRLVFLHREENLLTIPCDLISKIYLGSQISQAVEKEVVRLCNINFPSTDIFKMHLSQEKFQLIEQPY